MTAFPDGEFLVPLFPLPNLVFFPRTRLPLHVFEPRYRRMVADAVAGDQRFGIVLLRPGWEADYFGAPPIYECGTLGQIEQAVPLEDGRFNILVRGEVRFRVVGEVPGQPYRTARVILQPEQDGNAESSYAQRTWLAELSQQYLRFADQRELLASGLLDGSDVAQRPVVVDVPLAKGHVILFANNPVYRGETIGSYFLVFNALLNFDRLDSGRKLDQR